MNCCKADISDDNMYGGFQWRLHDYDYAFNKLNGNRAASSHSSSSVATNASSSSTIRGRYSRLATRFKDVYRVDPSTGEAVQYSSIENAAKSNRFSHYTAAEIRNCCNGETARAGGYMWKWSMDIDSTSLPGGNVENSCTEHSNTSQDSSMRSLRKR